MTSVILNEFPVPPSYIPKNKPAPSSFQNPPPSRPPTLPLPPIPGPSPLSDQDLFHITAATRSRRASRLSTSSRSSSYRESIVSVASGSSGPSPTPTSAVVTAQPSARQRTGSVTSTSTNSVRSFSSSNGSLSVPLPPYATTRATNLDHSKFPPVSVAINPAILEDDELFSVDPVEHVLTHTSLTDIPRATPSPLPYTRHRPTLHNESISSIDMRDLPALQDDDTADLDSQAHVLHVQMRAARSKSSTHKLHVRQAVSRTRRNASPTAGQDHGRTPSLTQRHRDRTSFRGAENKPPALPSILRLDRSDRASSPDIATFIAETPRSRRRSETSSARSRSRSQSRPRAPKSLPGSRRTSAAGRLSLFSLPDESARRQSEGSANLGSRSLLAYANRPGDDDDLWNDDSLEDYGVVIGGGDGGFPNVLDEEEAAGESDSSIDLHTPLPNLMLRDGMLSPHSKLLPQNIRVDSAVSTDGNRPGSTVSAATAKSGIFKDERDTIRRRVRHRDGRLLRGGIGLTTGLGWSDSEDEDAPSPLTRRLSHLSLSRQSSTTSLKTGPRSSRSHPHPLSHSFSSDAKVHPSNSTQNTRRTAVPLTSWQKRNRTTASTLSVSIPEHDSPKLTSSARFSEPPYSHVDGIADSQSNDQVRTPSSSSTQSLPGPITPDVSDLTPPHSAPARPWDRDKSLPPLPLSRGPSTLRPIASSSDLKNIPLKLGDTLSRQLVSSGSELTDPVVVSSQTPKVQNFYTVPTPRASRSTPRPLQLSASLGAVQPGEPASNQGLLLSYNRQLHDQQRARALTGPLPSVSTGQRYSIRPLASMKSSGFSRSESVDLSSLELGEPRLRPRTGTGMVYKKSSTSLTRAAADVQAQSRLRMPSERTTSVTS